MRNVRFGLIFLVGVVLPVGWLAAQQTTVSRNRILDDPLDFSAPPTLPEIDAPSASDIRAAIGAGVQFLLADQNPNGSWGSATRTKGLNIYAPVPGAHHAFRAATTSLCIAALLEVAPDDEDTLKAIGRAEEWLLEHLAELRRATGIAIYNVWGHAYSIQALVRLHEHHSEDAERQAKTGRAHSTAVRDVDAV